MTPDDVCQAAVPKGIRLATAVSDEAVMIAGDRADLHFLADLIRAIADDDDDSFAIGPFGAGNLFFASRARIGLWIFRCSFPDPRLEGEVASSFRTFLRLGRAIEGAEILGADLDSMTDWRASARALEQAGLVRVEGEIVRLTKEGAAVLAPLDGA